MSIEKKALEENIRSVLTDDIAREIVKFCKESHTSSEIIDQMLRKLSSMSSNRAWWERVVSDNLRRLENAQVVTYMADGKWKMSSEAKTILEKYFSGL